MIKISKQNNSLIVEGIENVFYPNNGQNSYPLNSLIVVTDNSDMATFRSVATNDVLFSGLIQNITINGEAVTKDNIIQKFDAVSNSSTGGGSTVDAYTKQEADNKFASKDELTNVQTVANDADTKVDALTPRVEGVETAMNNKQDTLVSGENIKTINSESILGTGDIQISGEAKIYDAKEINSTFNQYLSECVVHLNTGEDYTEQLYVSSNNRAIYNNFFNNIKYGDIVLINKTVVINKYRLEYRGVNDGYYRFAVLLNKYDNLKNFTADISLRYTENSDYITFATNNGGPAAKITDIPNTDNFATKDELTNVQTVANDADTKVNTLTPRVEGVETAMGNKQDTLVSGTNIKTINSQSILGSGDLTISGVSEEQAQEIAKIPTLETELAQKANVSDVPTVQNGRNGTNKNYVYSNAEGNNRYNRVISHCEFFKEATNILRLGLYYWGDEGARRQVPVPLATPSTAGIMSGDDKTKLDSIPETIPSQSEIDGIAANVSALQTAMDGKQPTLVSGTNIKTINGNSILGEGNLVIEGGGIDLSNYYTKTETDTKLDTKQNTLVSGTNIKTINSQSIIGEGNLEVTIPDATTATSGAMSAADKTKLDSISNEWTGTQSEYDALTTKDNNIIYYVTE